MKEKTLCVYYFLVKQKKPLGQPKIWTLTVENFHVRIIQNVLIIQGAKQVSVIQK